MTTPLEATHPNAVCEKLLQLYRPAIRLRTHHKKLLKTIWSFEQNRGGTTVECFSCHKAKPFEDITVHHNDGVEEHNEFGNLSPACYDCNIREGWLIRRRKKAVQKGQGTQSVSVRNVRTQTFAPNPDITFPISSSKESARHLKERQAFSLWLYEPGRGFASKEGVKFHPKGLAKVAVHGIGYIDGELGSLVTYGRYIEEDFGGGFWRIPPDDMTLIERTGKPFPFPEGTPQPVKKLEDVESEETQ